jgi:sugar phosphate isomerase/epimerase
MRLAFSTLACPGWSVEQVAQHARAYGYQGVELRLLDGEIIDPGMAASEKERVRAIFRDAGLPIVAVDSSIRVASGADGNQQDLRSFLELASEWESPLLRVFGGAPEDLSRDAALARAASVLEQAAPRAEELGVAIVLETHDTFASAADVAGALAQVPSPAVGVLWDTHHPHRMGEAPERVWDLVGPRVRHVHVKDARPRADGGWDLVLLGEGEVRVADAVRVLRRESYEGWLSVEWEKKWHPEIPEPEVALPQHAALLRQWLEA